MTDSRGASATSTALVSVRDTTPPVLTLPADITVAATGAAGAIVSFAATAVDVVSGTVSVSCTPASGATFPVGATTVSCAAADGRGNRATGSFLVRVQPATVPPALARFVVLGIEQVWLRANSRVVTGDVGANRAMPGPHRPWNADDDGEPDRQAEVIVGANTAVLQAGSRVMGDTVWLRARASVVDVVHNELVRSRTSKIAGTVSTPVSLPLVTLPALPDISPGSADIIVRRDKMMTLAPGRYRRIQLERRGTLILTGGQYQVQSIDLDEGASVLARAATELQVKSEVNAGAKVRIMVDPSAPALTGSSFTIVVAGRDDECRHDGLVPDGDNAGQSVVHVGAESTVRANVYAPNGLVWLKAGTSATGAFIGRRVRIGEGVTLKLESGF